MRRLTGSEFREIVLSPPPEAPVEAADQSSVSPQQQMAARMLLDGLGLPNTETTSPRDRQLFDEFLRVQERAIHTTSATQRLGGAGRLPVSGRKFKIARDKHEDR